MICVYFDIKFSNTLGDPEYLTLLRKICSLFGNVLSFSRNVGGGGGGDMGLIGFWLRANGAA